MIKNTNVISAYSICRKITLENSKTFFFASIFLDKAKRNSCYAVYAFCRYIDDLIDKAVGDSNGEINNELVIKTVKRWQSNLDSVYAGDSLSDPIMVAWADTLKKYKIDRTLPDYLIEGVMSDLKKSVRYKTFEELYDYCFKVASVVGLMVTPIFGYAKPETLDYAVDLGVAMQLTNILRDIGEDLNNNRIYLPEDELNKFELSGDDLFKKEININFIKLMKNQINRADYYYDKAENGIKMLSKESQITVKIMSINYRKILRRIEKNNYDVFHLRASTSLLNKIGSIPNIYFKTYFKNN
ncbi:MAG: phytoene/squalene synthase family protein [Chlorobiota bacterium]|nr:phytoene/squalene synthase family protein [Chlorobiota bacterium]QQS66994.1 MAG: phytoene/squalene synthase family protein [Chlorobiota bacterium]